MESNKTLERFLSVPTPRAFVAAAVAVAVLAASFMVFEPMMVGAQVTDNGPSEASVNISVSQQVDAEISISVPDGSISLAALNTSNNSAVGNEPITVTTNNNAGYTLSVANDDADNALQGDANGESFTDYAGPDSWDVSNDYAFGFAAFGDDSNVGPGSSSCTDGGTGGDPQNDTLIWDGFNGTTDIDIASSTGVTDFSGATTTLCVGTEQAGQFAPSGTYNATIVATATTN